MIDLRLALASKPDFDHFWYVVTVRDLLASHEASIREQIKLLRVELAEVKCARAALEQSGENGTEGPAEEVRDSRRTTIKDKVRSVISSADASKGLTAGEILDAIAGRFGHRIERTSLSPQLSRLRDSGDVVLQNGRWFPSEPHLSQVGRGPEKPAAMPPAMIGKLVDGVKAHQQDRWLPRSTATEDAMTQIGRTTSAVLTEYLSNTPNLAKAIQDAERKMRDDLGGSNGYKHWSSGSKTE